MTGVPYDPNEHRPFAQRGDSMYLNVLKNSDLLQCQMKKDLALETHTGLLTQDIFKANSHYSHKEVWVKGPPHKPPVPGAEPKQHYAPRNRAVDLTLLCCDIDKAQPNSIAFDTTRRTDPLVPSYKLPSVQMLPPDEPTGPPRDLMRLDDIQSGLPKRDPLWQNEVPAPQRTDCTDIEFALPNYHRRVVRPLPVPALCRNPLRTDDINDPRIFPGLSKSARSSGLEASGLSKSARGAAGRERNPMAPSYELSQTTTHPFFGGGAKEDMEALEHIGPVQGAQSKISTRDNGEPMTSLFCKDVPGAAPQRFKGQRPFYLYATEEEFPVVSFHDPADIDGAQAGSRLRKHMRGRGEQQWGALPVLSYPRSIHESGAMTARD